MHELSNIKNNKFKLFYLYYDKNIIICEKISFIGFIEREDTWIAFKRPASM